jgi:hypothetical protein
VTYALVYDDFMPTELLLTAPYTLMLSPYDGLLLKVGEVRARAT